MTMLCFDMEDKCFNYRVAGVALLNNAVLLCKTEGESFWFLPGGRVEWGETSIQGLQREMQEELKEEVQVERLLWIVESFFDTENQKSYHELGFFYLMKFLPDADIANTSRQVLAKDGQYSLMFKWFDLADLEKVVLYPPFLVQGLQNIPEQMTHLLDRQQS